MEKSSPAFDRHIAPAKRSETPASGSVSSWWSWVGAIAVALVLGLGLLSMLDALLTPFLLLIMGVTLSAAITPIVEWLERWLPRVVGVLLIYLVAILVLALILFIVVPPLVAQTQSFANNIPTYREGINTWLQSWSNITTDDIVNRITAYLSGAASSLAQLPLAIADRIFQVVLVLFVSIYWTLGLPKIRSFVFSLFWACQRFGVLFFRSFPLPNDRRCSR
jgi:predicted PurR-regulated permease PerM